MSLKSGQSDKTAMKVITLGELGVGKTTFVMKYCGETDKDTFDYLTKRVKVNNVDYTVIMCDTQGMEDVSYITAYYYNDAKGMLLMFDLSNLKSLDNLQGWYNTADMYAPKDESLKPVPILVGTKADSQTESDETIENEKNKNFRNFKLFKVSSKNGTGMDELMNELVSQIVAKFFVDKNKKPQKEKSGCCLLV
ncbi:hypothetical protein EIN_274260 [Entamoeba invadens IP1]|uniref:Uncharacterized protein n=1 Tax=Entamoeba invadens IP1 TaxID=370355 RepID=A0A0A1U1D8_ENTIV|nr:hypothetical protein EIN_274260 [Entamoeba invadens IP1]ELP87859.1 hypothetical protein EIN_274260 [Entamoeba invadens IP1]|eukprot:XP_004254630.1 hypothetical protein EIN_274260 [Entamoeba invadens IP1]